MRISNNEDQENVTCQCDHLTSFSILLVSVNMLRRYAIKGSPVLPVGKLMVR